MHKVLCLFTVIVLFVVCLNFISRNVVRGDHSAGHYTKKWLYAIIVKFPGYIQLYFADIINFAGEE